MIQGRAARWVTSRYSSYDNVTEMLSDLGWRSLENRRNDARLAMFYKITYGLVAVSVPTYFQRPIRLSRHMHPLSFRRYSFFPNDCCLVEPASVRYCPLKRSWLLQIGSEQDISSLKPAFLSLTLQSRQYKWKYNFYFNCEVNVWFWRSVK